MTATLSTRTMIENAMVTWLGAVTGKRIVIGWPNAPRALPLPYVTVRIMGMKIYGYDASETIDDNGVQTIYTDYAVTASVNAFGPGALDLLHALCNSMYLAKISQDVIDSGISPWPAGPITDLTAFLETEAEERAHVDFDVYIRDTYTDTPGVIEHVNADGTIVADTGTEFALSFAADLA